jgi:regulator of protease activity HflC (stomatin/prohibitin superfamily)
MPNQEHHGHDHAHGHDHGHIHHHDGGAELRGPVDPAQESLAGALQSGFRVLGVLMLVLMVAYVFSGVFQVQPGEQGLVVRFGKLRVNDKADGPEGTRYVFGPGLRAALPDPFDQKIRIPSQRFEVRIETFCYRREGDAVSKPLAETLNSFDKLTPGEHGAMLSGDRNLSHGVWTIGYRVANGEKFVRNIGESRESFEPTLKRLAENAIVRAVSGITVERVTRSGPAAGADFTEIARANLRADLERLETGVELVDVHAETIEPGRVREAFLGVVRAQNESDGEKSKARQERSRILSATAGPKDKHEALLAAIDQYGTAQTSGADAAQLATLRSAVDANLDRAEGEVAARLREARSRANEVRQSIEREHREFEVAVEMFRRSPDMTAVRLWSDMRDAILSSEFNDVFFAASDQETQLILNRDPVKAKEAEAKAYADRVRGGAPAPGGGRRP